MQKGILLKVFFWGKNTVYLCACVFSCTQMFYSAQLFYSRLNRPYITLFHISYPSISAPCA